LAILPKVIELFKTFSQVKQDCKLVSNETTQLLASSSNANIINIFKCASEAKETLANAKQFIADYQSDALPIEDLFEEGINVYTELVVVSRDCGIKKASELPSFENGSVLKLCVNDISGFVQSIQSLIPVVEDQDFSNFFSKIFAVS
jgi:hypothetical protein